MKNKLLGLSRYLLIFLIGVGLIAVYKTFDNFNIILDFIGKIFSVITPFIIGVVIAFFLYKPVSFLERHLKKIKLRLIGGHARAIAVAVVYLLVIVLVTLLLIFALPALIEGLVELGKSIPSYYEELIKWLNTLVDGLNLPETLDFTIAMDAFNNYILPYLSAENIIGSIMGVVSFASSLIGVLIAFFISIYLLLGRESLIRTSRVFLELFIPEKPMRRLTHYTKRSCQILYTYFYSQVLDAIVVAILMTIALSICQVKNAPIIGLIIGAANLIPYFGAIGSGAIVVIMQLLSPDGGVVKAVVVGIVILGIQQLDANFLQPRIIGTTVGIRPIYVLLAITVGGGFFGFLGIFLCVPCAAIIQMLMRDLVNYREQMRARKAVADGPPEEGGAPDGEEADAPGEEPVGPEDAP